MSALPPNQQPPRPLEGRTERKPPANAYAAHAHHRNTSIVNGFQHSRSGSYLGSSNAASPIQVLEGQIEIPQIPESPTTPTAQINHGTATLSGTHVAGSISSGYEGRTHKSTRSRSHHHHQSQHETTKSPTEYALHILFTQFVSLADRIINSCVPPKQPMDHEPYVDRICGPGVDPVFDKLINSLGSLGKHKPKPVIDSVMYWRKMKSEQANAARQEYEEYMARQNQPSAPSMPGALARRNTEPVEPGGREPWNQAYAMKLKEAWFIADRKTTLSIYVLCRALIEVVQQSTLENLTPEMAEKLQDIVFKQISTKEPQALLNSPLQLANWTVLAQLLGVIGNIDFERVTDRLFFVWLEQTQNESQTRDLEGRMEYVVRAMGFLKLRLYPEEALRESSEFMVSLARFFAKARGFGVKHAYCDVFTKLLIPVAGSATTELNHPIWAEFVNTLYEPLLQMCNKPKHWNIAFPLLTIILCVAPGDVFSQQWSSFLDMHTVRLRDKDRTSKVHVLQAIARLLWVFLFRCPAETLNATTKKLENIVRILLQANPKKRETSVLIGDQTVVNPGIEIIRLIGFKFQDLCFRTIVFPLLNSDALAGNTGLNIDQISPERMVIGIRAFMAVMADLESGKQPPFPERFGSGPARIPVPEDPNDQESKNISAQIGRSGRISQAVNVTKLGETAREYHDRFCEILGKIVSICDANFGGQTVLEEKLAGPQQPRTPVTNTFSFGLREEHPSVGEQKRHFYELLHVCIQALPRCLPPNIPFPKVVNLLCNGTAHTEKFIAEASAHSLKSIARQYNSQQVIMGFSRFIFTFDEKYSNQSDGGMLGFNHIEGTLALYVELLQIWLENIKKKTKDSKEAVSAAALAASLGSPTVEDVRIIKDLESSNIKTYVEEIESNGLFFLCSQSRVVRRSAVTILRLIKEFDAALDDRDTYRIIDILEKDSLTVIDLNDENLPVAERSRLHRELRESKSQDALIQMATSDLQYEVSLWFRVFPSLIRACFDRCPTTVALCRDNVCSRLSQMYSMLMSIADLGRSGTMVPGDGSMRAPNRAVTQMRDIMVAQWKLYLIVACATLTATNDNTKQQINRVPSHVRKGSKNQGLYPPAPQERITNATGLFQMITPLLSTEYADIRDAVVMGLGSINVNIYRPLVEVLQTIFARLSDDKRKGGQTGGQMYGNRRRADRMRADITHIYQLTSHFLQRKEGYSDEWILKALTDFVKDTKHFLSNPDVMSDWEQQPLRTYFCGLVESLYEGLIRTGNPSRWLPFEGRMSLFTLIERWCGYGPNWAAQKMHEEQMMQIVRNQARELDKGRLNRTMEIEKRNLRVAALNAMACLCAGPIVETVEGKAIMHFDVEAVFAWIEAIFAAPSDRFHKIGRRALKNVLLHNQDNPFLLNMAIRRCYLFDDTSQQNAKAAHSYFMAVAEVLEEISEYPYGYWKTIALCLFKIGDDDLDVRIKAANLLRVTEERLFGVSKVQDFEVSISDKTMAVYKRAAFELSKALSKMHPQEALFVISEFTMFFNEVESKAQRGILAVLLPWIQAIELQLDPSNDPTPPSYMVLANLFEITVRFTSVLHHEVEALWTALATAHAGNVQVVLSFIINQSLERKEPNFVEYGKQIVVFLAGTAYGAKLVEALVEYLQPRLTTTIARERSAVPDESQFPYLAELSRVLPEGVHQTSYSYGHLALILLVDLLVGPNPKYADMLPLLLQNIFIHWDSHIPLVQEQAKEMLIHLIHELVIPTMNHEKGDPGRQATREFIETVRRKDPSTCWGNEDVSSEEGLRVPTAMEHMISDVLEIFTPVVPSLKEEWGRISLQWATSLPVLKLACRSFQVFRCMLTTLDQSMLADMLARLSTTIADDKPDIRLFAMEILITLNTIAGELDGEDLMQYPQIFWTAVACLNTVHEREFLEVLSLLDNLLDKLDLRDPAVVSHLIGFFPQKWEGTFEGVQDLIVKGLRSSVTLEKTLAVFDKLNLIPSNSLIGTDSRLLLAVLANLPRFLHALEENGDESPPADIIAAATALHALADGNCPPISRIMSLYSRNLLRPKAFVTQTVSALRESFFPTYEAETLIFLTSLLSNSLPWVKNTTLTLLSDLLPHINMRHPTFSGMGADIISPLLRLLQTSYCSQALAVLDKTQQQVVSSGGSSLDRHYVRMSMSVGGGAGVRREYDDTRSLYGVPEESGWSVPMRRVAQACARGNVHAVFYTCRVIEEESGVGGEDSGTLHGERESVSEVEFHMEEYNYAGLGMNERTTTMLSDGGGVEVEDIVSRLETLDAFFTDDTLADGTEIDHDGSTIAASEGHSYTSYPPSTYSQETYVGSGRGTPSTYSHHLHTPSDNKSYYPPSTPPTVHTTTTGITDDPTPYQLYDSRVAAILNRSLARRASVTSFHFDDRDGDGPGSGSGGHSRGVSRSGSRRERGGEEWAGFAEEGEEWSRR